MAQTAELLRAIDPPVSNIARRVGPGIAGLLQAETDDSLASSQSPSSARASGR